MSEKSNNNVLRYDWSTVRKIYETLFGTEPLHEDEYVEISYTAPNTKNYTFAYHVWDLDSLSKIDFPSNVNFGICPATRLLKQHELNKRTSTKQVYRARAIILDIENRKDHKYMPEEEFEAFITEAYDKLPEDVRNAVVLANYTGGGGQFIVVFDRWMEKEEAQIVWDYLKEKLAGCDFVDPASFVIQQSQRLVGTVNAKYGVLSRIAIEFTEVTPLSVDPIITAARAAQAKKQEASNASNIINQQCEENVKKYRSTYKNLWTIVREIKKRVRIMDFFGLEVKGNSENRYYCLCPIHEEKHPSFEVFVNTNSGDIAIDYHPDGHKGIAYPEWVKRTQSGNACFDVISLYMLKHDVGFIEAVKALAESIGMKEQIHESRAGAERIIMRHGDVIDVIYQELFKRVDELKEKEIMFDITQGEFLMHHMNSKSEDKYTYITERTLRILIEPVLEILIPQICEELEINKPPRTSMVFKMILMRIPKIRGLTYEPLNTASIIEKEGDRYFNCYTPTEYDKMEKTEELDDMNWEKYPTIYQFFKHVFGYYEMGEKKVKRIVHTLAWYLKEKGKIGVSLLLYGDQGSGKNVFADTFLKPIVGENNFSIISEASLESQFNDWIENRRVIVANEIRLDYQKKSTVLNTLKSLITDNTVRINGKYRRPKTITNHADIIIFSNYEDAVKIEPTDRRFFVIRTGPSMKNPITGELHQNFQQLGFKTTKEVVDKMEEERPEFIKDLLRLKIDKNFLQSDLYTPEKINIIRKSMSSLDFFVYHITSKDRRDLLRLLDLLSSNLNEALKDRTDDVQRRMLKGIIQIFDGYIEPSNLLYAYEAFMGDPSKTQKTIQDRVSASCFQNIRLSVNNQARRVKILRDEGFTYGEIKRKMLQLDDLYDVDLLKSEVFRRMTLLKEEINSMEVQEREDEIVITEQMEGSPVGFGNTDTAIADSDADDDTRVAIEQQEEQQDEEHGDAWEPEMTKEELDALIEYARNLKVDLPEMPHKQQERTEEDNPPDNQGQQ